MSLISSLSGRSADSEEGDRRSYWLFPLYAESVPQSAELHLSRNGEAGLAPKADVPGLGSIYSGCGGD
jgi:hypothetical protein